MNLFTLMATLGLNTANFVQGIKSATQAGQDFAKKTGSTVSAGVIALGNLMAKAVEAAGKAVIDLGKTGLEYNATMEDYTTNFRVMLGSEEAAVRKVAELREMAAATPFGMAELASGTQTLLAFGIEADEVNGILSMLGDVALGDKNKLSSLTLAFAQMSSTGKLTGQDLNQMINAGFNPLQVIAEKTGVSIGDLKEKMSGGRGSREFQRQIRAAQKEVRKFGDDASEGAKILAQIGEDGEISAEMVALAFEMATSEGGQFFNGMEEASKTLNGQLSTLEDNSTALIGRFFEPVSEMLTDSILPKVNEFVDVLTSAYDEGGFSNMFRVGVDWVLNELQLPSVSDIEQKVSDWWNGVSGENAYETIKGVLKWTWGNWVEPGTDSLKTNVSTWWENTALPAIKNAAKWTWGELVVPAWADLSQTVSDWWTVTSDEIKKIAIMKWEGLEFPSWEDVKSKAEASWKSIKEGLAGLFRIEIGISGFNFIGTGGANFTFENAGKLGSTLIDGAKNRQNNIVLNDVGTNITKGIPGTAGVGSSANGVNIGNINISAVPQSPRDLVAELNWSLQNVRFST